MKIHLIIQKKNLNQTMKNNTRTLIRPANWVSNLFSSLTATHVSRHEKSTGNAKVNLHRFLTGIHHEGE